MGRKKMRVFKISIDASGGGYSNAVAYVRAISKENAEKQLKKLFKYFGIRDIVKNHDSRSGCSFVETCKNRRVVFIEEIPHVKESEKSIKELLQKRDI